MQRQLPDITAEAKSTAPILDVAVGESEALLSFNQRSFLNLLPAALQEQVTDYGDPYVSHSFGKLTLFPSAIKNRDAAVITLLTHVIRGELTKADAMLQREPSLALEENTVTDYPSKRTIQGTALKIALGALDVSVHVPCDLIAIPDELTLDLAIGILSEKPKAIYVRHRKKLYYSDHIHIGDKLTEISLTEAQQKEFDAAFSLKIPAERLSKKDSLKQITALTGRSRAKNMAEMTIWQELEAAHFPKIHVKELSKDSLNQITAITGHIHAESMAEMIMRHLRKLSIPNGEAQIAKQIKEQFPVGWEIKEAKRAKRDKEALQTVFTEIKNAKTNGLVDLATRKFKDYLKKENDPKNIIKTGKQFNEQLLVEALKLSHAFKELPYITKLVWRVVLVCIERYVPTRMCMLLDHYRDNPRIFDEKASKLASLVSANLKHQDGDRLSRLPRAK